MADKGAAAKGGAEEGKEGEDKEPEKGCCDKYAECLVVTGKVPTLHKIRPFTHVVWLCALVLENVWHLFGILAKRDAVVVWIIVISIIINGRMKDSQMFDFL
jgi:hypothetical protein